MRMLRSAFRATIVPVALPGGTRMICTVKCPESATATTGNTPLYILGDAPLIHTKSPTDNPWLDQTTGTSVPVGADIVMLEVTVRAENPLFTSRLLVFGSARIIIPGDSARSVLLPTTSVVPTMQTPLPVSRT